MGPHHLPVAKLVAATMLVRWRQQLIDLDRLVLADKNMNHDNVINIVGWHPLIVGGGYLPVQPAAAVLGLAPKLFFAGHQMATRAFITGLPARWVLQVLQVLRILVLAQDALDHQRQFPAPLWLRPACSTG